MVQNKLLQQLQCMKQQDEHCMGLVSTCLYLSVCALEDDMHFFPAFACQPLHTIFFSCENKFCYRQFLNKHALNCIFKV